MSDKASLTHRLQTENSSSKEKSLKDVVCSFIYNFIIFLSLIFSPIIISKIKIVIK